MNMFCKDIQKVRYEESNSEESYVKLEHDCSIYNKLTRKCNCLNQPEFNDFILHFNENTKYTTNHEGEIIKNIRILKKFMYMGVPYTRNALMFLNDGISQSSHKENVEIIQGCSHADIYNIFEEHSIVTVCISYRLPDYEDCIIQAQTASLLLKLAEMEEGRKYLNLNSKLASDIQTILKEWSSHFEPKTIEHLSTIMDILKPIPKTLNVYLSTTISENTEYTQENMKYNRNQMISRAQNTYTVKRASIIPTFTN